MVDSIETPKGGYGGVIVGSLVGSDFLDYGDAHPDRAHVDVAQCHLGDGVVLFILCLHCKGDGYAVQEFEVWVVVLNQFSVLEKPEVVKAEDVGSLLICLGDFEVFA